jgi:hypothetical protein
MTDAIKNILGEEALRLMKLHPLVGIQNLPLNIHESYRPNMTATQALNEHVANWIDQVNAQARFLNMHNIAGNILITREASQNGAEPTIVAKFGPNYLPLGTIQRHKHNGIVFHNRASVIGPGALLLGGTHKTGDADSIGAHGEGFKTAVNRLVALGYVVQYQTHGETWNFSHEKCNLFVKRFSNPTNYERLETMMTIVHESENVLACWDDSRFLCLAEWYIKPGERAGHMFTLNGDGLKIEVLIDPNHHGELFSNGILVSTEKRNYTGPYGFNFRGKSMTPGRDRNSFTRSQLLHAFNNVFKHLSHAMVVRALEMVKEGTLFYDLICVAKHNKWSWISAFVTEARRRNWYPCKDEKDAKFMQDYFNQPTIVVTDNYAELLIHAGGFLPPKEEALRRFHEHPSCETPQFSNQIDRILKILEPTYLHIKYVKSHWKLPCCWNRENATVNINLTACTLPNENILNTVAFALESSAPGHFDYATRYEKAKQVQQVLLEERAEPKRVAAVVVLDEVPAKRQRSRACKPHCAIHCQ